ncbi:hypothetical protein ACWCQZ_50550 [Streptomyces sp. NPDC002285]
MVNVYFQKEKVNHSTFRNGSSVRTRRRVGLIAALILASLAVPTVSHASAPGRHILDSDDKISVQSSALSHGSLHAGDQGPDPDRFGVDGKIGVHASSTSDDFFVKSALYSDGRILASGYRKENGVTSSIVSRRQADGSPDVSFGGGTGVVSVPGLNGPALSVAPATDGGVVGVGWHKGSNGRDMAVFRLDAAGNLLTKFGLNGIVTFPTPGTDFGTDLTVQPDGKIVVVGFTTAADGNSDVAVRRLLSNGKPDPLFGTAGEALVDLSPFDVANGVALQRDGKIVVVGQTAKNDDAFAIRLGNQGSLDQSFGDSGVVTLNATGYEEGYGVVVRPDAKIDIVGYTTDLASDGNAIIFQLQSDGSRDNAFSDDGQIVMSNPGDDYGFGIGLQSDSSIVVTAYQAQQPSVVTDSYLHRITSNGRLDSQFGNNGTFTVHNEEATFELGLSVLPDDKIVVAGRRGGFNIIDSIATIDRYTSNGLPDVLPTNS